MVVLMLQKSQNLCLMAYRSPKNYPKNCYLVFPVLKIELFGTSNVQNWSVLMSSTPSHPQSNSLDHQGWSESPTSFLWSIMGHSQAPVDPKFDFFDSSKRFKVVSPDVLYTYPTLTQPDPANFDQYGWLWQLSSNFGRNLIPFWTPWV